MSLLAPFNDMVDTHARTSLSAVRCSVLHVVVVILSTASSKLRSWVGYKSAAVADRPHFGPASTTGVQRQVPASVTASSTARTSQLHRSASLSYSAANLLNFSSA